MPPACPPLATTEPITLGIMLVSASLLTFNLRPLLAREAPERRGCSLPLGLMMLIGWVLWAQLIFAKPALEAALLAWQGEPTTGVITAHTVVSSAHNGMWYDVTVDYTVPTGAQRCDYRRDHLSVSRAFYRAFPSGTPLRVWYLPAAPGVIALDPALHTWPRSIGLLLDVHGVAIAAGLLGRRWPRTARRRH